MGEHKVSPLQQEDEASSGRTSGSPSDGTADLETRPFSSSDEKEKVCPAHHVPQTHSLKKRHKFHLYDIAKYQIVISYSLRLKTGMNYAVLSLTSNVNAIKLNKVIRKMRAGEPWVRPAISSPIVLLI